MRLPRWLDRESRIRHLKARLHAKHLEVVAAVNRVQALAHEKRELLMDLDSARADLAHQKQRDVYIGTEAERIVLAALDECDSRLARYRTAWRSARARATRHRISATEWRKTAEKREAERRQLVDEHVRKVQDIMRQVDYALIPVGVTAGMAPVGSRDRENALALADRLDEAHAAIDAQARTLAELHAENAELRKAVLREPGDTP